MVTIKDIAKESGFSVSTVSRALADSSLIPKKSKDSIKKIAKKMGYVPNLTAKSLKNNKYFNVGIISFVDKEFGFSHRLFSGILNSFIVETWKKKYDITIIPNYLLDNGDDLVVYCKSRNISAVFLLTGSFSAEQMKKLHENNIVTVIIDAFDCEDSDNTYNVSSNNREIMKKLTDEIIKKGHKRIVYVHGEDFYVTKERILGFKDALAENGLKFSEDMLVKGHYYDIPSVRGIIDGILAKEEVPTCIMMPDDYCAIGAYDVLRGKNMRIPEDMSIAGFDGLEYVKHTFPEMTTVVQDVVSLGKKCAEVLISALNGNKPEHLTLVDACINEGKSVRTIR